MLSTVENENVNLFKGSRGLDFKDVSVSIGKLFEAYGLKPSCGRVWAYLFFKDKSEPGYSAKDLVKITGYSITVITDALLVLREHKLIHQVPSLDKAYRWEGDNHLDKVLEEIHAEKTDSLTKDIIDLLSAVDLDPKLQQKTIKKFQSMIKTRDA